MNELGGSILNQTFMDPHLKTIPSLRALTTRRFAGGDFKNLSRESDRAFNTKVLGFGAFNQVRGNCSIKIKKISKSATPPQDKIPPNGGRNKKKITFLQRLNFPRGKSDTNAVGLRPIPELALLWFVVRHYFFCKKMAKRTVFSTVEGCLDWRLVGWLVLFGGRGKLSFFFLSPSVDDP